MNDLKIINGENMNSYEIIKEKKSISPSWQSDKKSIIQIFHWCSTHNINTTDALNAPQSNLRVIIRNAKQAIENEDIQRLSELFSLAATMSNHDLRIALGSAKRDTIKAIPNGNGEFSLALSEKQLGELTRGMKLKFNIQVAK